MIRSSSALSVTGGTCERDEMKEEGLEALAWIVEEKKDAEADQNPGAN